MTQDLDHDERVPGFTVYADPPWLFHLSGELDVATTPALTDALQAQIRHGGSIGLDLAKLTFMDSSGINAICRAARLLGDRGRIVVLNLPRSIRRIVAISGIDGVIDIDEESSSMQLG